MYNALVVELKNVEKHPNADRLNIADAGGYTVVVGLDSKDGDVGIVFPCDGQLSEEYAQVNDLVRRKDDNGNNAGGMFDANRRVRAQSFRGVRSEAFSSPRESLAYTKYNLADLKPGSLFSELNGHVICQKYITPATARAMKGGTQATKRKNVSFHEHYDTTQLRHYTWPENAIVYVTYKLHGTSGRTGLVMDENPAPNTIWGKVKEAVRGLVWREPVGPTKEWKVISGTRRTIMADGKPGFYADESFRRKSVESFVPFLKKNEVIYYELVGYTSDGGLIMGEHDVKKAGDKELVKQYGDKIRYTYGTLPGETDLYVYHIKHVNEDGDAIDLPWHHVKARCKELGLKHVPELNVMTKVFTTDWLNYGVGGEGKTGLESIVAHHADGPDPICPAHIREGIVFRVEHDGKVDFVKQKGYTFQVLEGIVKNDDSYVDTEEIS